MTKKKKAKKVTKKSAGYIAAKDGITNSLLQKWLSCRQAARFQIDGVRREFSKPKTTLGSIFHDLLEQWYGANKQTLKQVFGSTEEKWRSKAVKRGEDLQMLEGVFASAEPLFHGYAEHYAAEDAKKKWLQLEGVFDVQWESWRLRGRCDGVYEATDGSLWLLETKTKSRISEDTLSAALNFDPQNLLYLTAKEKEIGRKINGVLYNVIRQPSLRQKQNESRVQFFDRIKADIAERPDHYFIRYEVKYTERQKKAYREDLIVKLNEFCDWDLGILPTYKSECSCQRGWACEFLEACATGKLVGYRNDGELFSELQEDD